MGHLISRAFRRLTQCSQARNPLPEATSEQNSSEQQNNDQQNTRRATVESIPVGQSIDSADYPIHIETRNKTKHTSARDHVNDDKTRPNDPRHKQESLPSIEKSEGYGHNNKNNVPIFDDGSTSAQVDAGQLPTLPAEAVELVKKAAATITDENSKPQDVEEAVIKIQAYVRGHLTRKALRDAHQQMAPNAIGQRQFDEDSLIRNPPSAIFSPSSPLSATLNLSASTGPSEQQKVSITKAPLESIAEVSEASSAAPTAPQTSSASERRSSLANTRKRLSPIPITLTEDSATGRGGSVSPVPSEAGASIDLGTCATPASASIDIADHNIQPADKLATVLHHKATVTAAAAATAVVAAAAPSVSEPETLPSIAADELSTQPSNENNTNNDEVSSGLPRFELEHPVNTRTDNAVELPASSSATTTATTTTDTMHQNGQPSASSDPFETEEAAAIRIQSAFRGYRSRKNSPYRTRSPQNSSSTMPHTSNNNNNSNDNNNINSNDNHTNNIDHHDSVQQDSSIDTNVSFDRSSFGLQNSGQLADDADDEMSEQIGAIGSQLARRTSRSHRRDEWQSSQPSSSGDSKSLQQQQQMGLIGENQDRSLVNSNLGDTLSLEDYTATTEESTVKEVKKLPLDSQSSEMSGGVLEDITDRRDSKPEVSEAPSKSATERDASQVTDLSAALDEATANLSAALEEAGHQDDGVAQSTGGPHTYAPADLGANIVERSRLKSEASFDTDSSNLGAAMSLNEEVTSEVSQAGGPMLVGSVVSESSALPVSGRSDEIDTDRSVGASLAISDELASEARKLVEELDAAMGGDGQLLDEEEQLAIELESDDIERRDPRGKASEDRTKSPQIRVTTEQPSLIVGEKDVKPEEGPESALGIDESSSPALGSSRDGSSDENGTDDEGEDAEAGQGKQSKQSQQQQSSPSPTTGNKHPGGNKTNKKRGNRNKKRGKK